MKISNSTRAILIITLIILIDQILKVWIKTNMVIGQEYRVFGDWFIIRFIENNGMAFGMEFWGKYGKLFLTLFRIVAVTAIGIYLYRICKRKINKWYIATIALIFAGALGNIIDSVFYGVLFDSSNMKIAQFLPEAGGYSSWLHGKVVDMFYFPIFEGNFPDWFPFWSGEHFIFFRPIFNIADAAISVGIVMFFFTQKLVNKK